MGRFKDIFTDLYNELFGFDINVEDKREEYYRLKSQQNRLLVTSKDKRKSKYFVLNDKIMIINMLRDEPELLADIVKMAREDGFLVDSLYARIEIEQEKNKANMTIIHDFSKPNHKDMNIDEFEHILVIKEDIDEPTVNTRYVTDDIRGNVTKIIKKVFTSKSKKPSNNLEFLSYRVKKLIESRKNFYRSISETDRFIFTCEESSDMSEHEEVLSTICNFQ